MYGAVAWFGVNTVLGTMNALLISFYSPQPFWSVFWTAQLTTHTICVLVEVVIVLIGNRLYARAAGTLRRLVSFAILLGTAICAALLGALLAEQLNRRLLGLGAFVAGESGEFYRLVFGSILLAIVLASFDRWNRGLNRRRLESQAALREARLLVLQQRMKPHFLFNALNSIHALLRKDAAAADRAILALADTYRFLLEAAESTLVPFESEWEFCRSYIELERIRFADRLTVDIELRDTTASGMVPPLSIQPLVENAFRHGVRRITGPAYVGLRARQESGDWVVTVEDNGPGWEVGPEVDRGTLGNIRTRLVHLLGSGSIQVSPRPEGGTIVELRFPAGQMGSGSVVS